MKKFVLLSAFALLISACSSDTDKSTQIYQTQCAKSDVNCFESECSKDNALSCEKAAELIYWGEGGAQKDEIKAKAYLEKSCDL